MRFGIKKKFICAFLLVALFPLLSLSIFTWIHVNRAGGRILNSSQSSLRHYSITLLETQAKSIAAQVEGLLNQVNNDLNLLAIMPLTEATFVQFVQARTRDIWIQPETPPSSTRKTVEKLRLYWEAGYVDAHGQERIRIQDGAVMPGRDVSKTLTGEHGPENYFAQTRNLKPGDIYVSHLTGWHVERKQNTATAGTGAGNGREPVDSYRGHYRFARPVYQGSRFIGMVTLALDQRHLMELTRHVLPFGQEEVVSTDYFSGDYAFLFDNEGWAITHPKSWDIRGFDKTKGRLCDPLSEQYTEAALKSGRVPFNLLHVPFIHPSYQRIAEKTLSGQTGFSQARNVSGIPRILVFAPIRFYHGDYRGNGIFGGITLGAQANLFQQTIIETSKDIDGLLNKMRHNLVVIITLSGLGVTLMAIWLSRSFTRPILAIQAGVRRISRGRFSVELSIGGSDELALLAQDVQELGQRLQQHVEQLDAYYIERARLTDDALKRRQLIESIFKNMLSGLMVFDHQDRVLSANPRAADFLDQEEQSLIGQHVLDIFRAYPKMRDLIVNDPENSGPVLSSIDLKLPDGRTLYLETTRARLIPEKAPEEKKILFIFRDVTKRKNMEMQLNRSNRLISIGILAAGIAHEIRNPLTGIALMLDDLHDRMATRLEERLMMESALKEIEKLDRIISELLVFASKSGTRPKASGINQVVDITLFFIKKQYKKAHITLTKNLNPDLPLIQIDTEKMKQALLNILLNALAVLSGQDDGAVFITTQFSPASDLLCGHPAVILSVRDNGPGITPKDLEFIFDPFYSKTPGGFGLGLSITHTIIEEHNGKMMVESEPDDGACFIIHLPVPPSCPSGGRRPRL